MTETFWDSPIDFLIGAVPGHTNQVNSVSFSPLLATYLSFVYSAHVLARSATLWREQINEGFTAEVVAKLLIRFEGGEQRA